MAIELLANKDYLQKSSNCNLDVAAESRYALKAVQGGPGPSEPKVIVHDFSSNKEESGEERR